ncbi:MAG: 4Fe-4S dicluster domain-containing protein [Candidatus Thorarchaeota archaeon]
MPIDKDFRQTWSVSGNHRGHAVWTRPGTGSEIHGTRVGVLLDECTACMKCVASCPTHVFETMNWRGAVTVDPVREIECILCLACELVCPPRAIHIQRSGGSQETLDSLLR